MVLLAMRQPLFPCCECRSAGGRRPRPPVAVNFVVDASTGGERPGTKAGHEQSGLGCPPWPALDGRPPRGRPGGGVGVHKM